MRTFVVGGAVRDVLLGREAKDLDFVVVGATPQDMLAQGFSQVGADFPVFLHPETKEEFALARRERKTAPGYHGFEVDFDTTVTLEEDLSRRDLTINAMAVAQEDWETFLDTRDTSLVVDPFGGLEHLKQGRLHIVSEAFGEDPVRVLRAARFQARYGFPQTAETTIAINSMVKNGELDSLVPERVWAETHKALMETDPLDFFAFLDFHDAARDFFKKLRLTPDVFENMDNRHGLSAKARMALLLVGLKNDNQVKLFLENLKAPNEFVNLAVTTHRLVSLANGDMTAADAVDVLSSLGAFGSKMSVVVEALTVASRVTASRSGAFEEHVFVLQALLPRLAAVKFHSLSKEQQDTLVGADVGAALGELRVALLADALENGVNELC